MDHSRWNRDDDVARYINYYKNQANQVGGIQGFSGSNVMYGAGLGGLFRGMFRIIAPLFRSGFNLARPHITTAAKGFAGDVIRHIATRGRGAPTTPPDQSGAGLMVMNRGLGRPPGGRAVRGVKKRVTGRRASVKTQRLVRRRPVLKRKASKKHRRTSVQPLGFKPIF